MGIVHSAIRAGILAYRFSPQRRSIKNVVSAFLFNKKPSTVLNKFITVKFIQRSSGFLLNKKHEQKRRKLNLVYFKCNLYTDTTAVYDSCSPRFEHSKHAISVLMLCHEWLFANKQKRGKLYSNCNSYTVLYKIRI